MIRNYTFMLGILLILSSCGSAKKAEGHVQKGNYDDAFELAYTELAKDKHKKSNQKLIPTLKEAYDKANDRDRNEIKVLKRDNDSSNLKKIYALYVALDVRQDDVISLQPLYYGEKQVSFKTKDYDVEVANSLKNYSNHLYSIGQQQMRGTKLDAREAFKAFNELEFVNPSYSSNVSNLIKQAKLKGSSLVFLKLENKIQTQIPQEHLDELLRISASNMTDKWVDYHTKKDYNVPYDYEVLVGLEKLQISQGAVNTQKVPQQKRIQDGWKYVYDSKGNVMKDKEGNDMKEAKIITVQAEVMLYQQLKQGRIDGSFAIKNLKNNTDLGKKAVFGEAKFENVYGKFRGDQRAIEEKYHKALQTKEAAFPKDEDFIKYAIADLKNKMLQALDQQKF